MDTINGIWGHPYIDLTPHVDTSRFGEIDEEVCHGLAQVEVEYTGGSHRTLGIVPPSLRDEPYVDYGEVIRAFSEDEFARFISLADEPGEFNPERRAEYEFGEERPYPLSKQQMLYLKFRHGVYFPWKVFYEMIPAKNWADKSNGFGKSFTEEARALFPKTCAFVRTLPFLEIGRCNILGLEAHDHGTVHNDGDPGLLEADHFITLCPRGDKRLFLWDETHRRKEYVRSRVYWFNDHGYHGVEADPYFRYSIRVDGVFRPAFLDELRRSVGQGPLCHARHER